MHCFYWKQISESRKKKELSFEELEKIAKNYGRLLYLSIGGGEPFLRNDLPEICEAFRKHTGVPWITLTTNGLLSKKIISELERALKKCPDVDFTIPLSIDGLDGMQDSIRGVKGCFEKVMETYRLLAELNKKYKNFSIDVNTVISTYNEKEAEKIMSFVKKKMPQARNHTLCFIRGAIKDERAREVSVARFKEIIAFEKKLKEQGRKKRGITDRLFDSLGLSFNEITLNFLEGKPMNWNCYAGDKLLEINETGDVFPCEILSRKIGSVRESNYDVGKILGSKAAKKEIRKIKCRECNCTFECAIANSLVYSPEKYPKVFWDMGKV